MKFKRKNNDVEAIQWNGSNLEEIKSLIGFAKETNFQGEKVLKIKLTNGIVAYASIGNYIVKDDTEVFVLTEESFNKLYEVIKIKNKIKEDLKDE